MTTKVSKRLEANKVRSAYNETPRRLLIPLSLGVSSLALLHILDQHVRAQLEKSSRTPYTLHVLFVDESHFLTQPVTYTSEVEKLKQRFPLHVFSIASLDEVYDYEIPDLDEIIMAGKLSDETHLQSQKERLTAMLSSLSSATSRLDIINTLRRRLLMAFAQRHDCSGILFGDSTTRLAERTLSETAKGRGASLPWLTADGTLDGLQINYPMRDLLKREIIQYLGFIEPSLALLAVNAETVQDAPVSSKDTTIDGLMSQYFASVEQNYPSIVANVVRTSGRLAASADLHRSTSCHMCGLPFESSSEAWAGDQGSLPLSANGDEARLNGSRTLCYGCTRSIAAR